MTERETIERLSSGELPVDFNWNAERHPRVAIPVRISSEPTPGQARKVILVSEDLRDGLHGVPKQPALVKRIEYVGQMYDLGIRSMTVGIFPGTEGSKIDRTTRGLLAEMKTSFPEVTPIVLTLARQDAIDWTLKCKAINPRLTSIAFMGTAPSRLLVEGWSQELIEQKLAWLVRELVKGEVDVIGATEHTTQTPPDFLERIIRTQVLNGANRVCLADTIGWIRPIGAVRLTGFVRGILHEMGRDDVIIDWHGHRDTGNEVGNALAAISAGAEAVHVVARGVGERSGNTSMEAVMINLAKIVEEGGQRVGWDLSKLDKVLAMYSKMVGVETPQHGPLSANAFRTTVGIHTAAILKAEQLAQEAGRQGKSELKRRLEEMSRTVYAGVDAEKVGRKLEVAVGPYSGASTVRLAASHLGIEAGSLSDGLIQTVLDTAKNLDAELTEEQLKTLLHNNHH